MLSMSNKKCNYCGNKFNNFKSLNEHVCEINKMKKSVKTPQASTSPEQFNEKNSRINKPTQCVEIVNLKVSTVHERKMPATPMETEDLPDKEYEIENSYDTLELQSNNSEIPTQDTSECFELNDPLKLEESIIETDLKFFSDGQYNCQLCCATFSQIRDSQIHHHSHETEKSSTKNCEIIKQSFKGQLISKYPFGVF